MANESKEGLRFAQEVLAQCDGFKAVHFFVVLDKASRDNTRELMEAYVPFEPRLQVVWAPDNRSVVDAYLRGYREAINVQPDWILEIDAGFSHDPAEIPRFFGPMLAGYDCAFGSRFMPGGRIVDSSFSRRMVSYGGTLLTNVLIGTKLHDMTSGFEMFTLAALQQALAKGIHSRAHFFQTEIKIHCRKLRITEVPITYRSASPNLSQTSVKEAFSQLWRLFKLRLSGKLDQPLFTPECKRKPA